MSPKANESAPPPPAWLDARRRPYVIAEAGVNHNGDLGLALRLIDAAKDAGADCVKFQAFSADELAVQDAPKADYQKRSGLAGESQHDMLRRHELPESAFRTLQARCRELGLDFLATPFSIPWVERLVQLGVTAIKIASGHLTALPYLQAVGHTRLPVILSTGMSNLQEVKDAIDALRQAGCGPLALLHCVSLYPTPQHRANLAAIHTLARHTQLPVGFSDHTLELDTGALAVAAGATILEKHLTLDKTLPGPDHALSLTPDEFAPYAAHARRAAAACGTGVKEPLPEELPIRNAARLSITSAVDIPPNTPITRQMLTIKRPGTGIPPAEINRVINAISTCCIPPDQTITPDMIKPDTES